MLAIGVLIAGSALARTRPVRHPAPAIVADGPPTVTSGVELRARVNVGIAVATDGALVVPTIFDADDKSIGVIGIEARRLPGGGARRHRDTRRALRRHVHGVLLAMHRMTAITPVIRCAASRDSRALACSATHSAAART